MNDWSKNHSEFTMTGIETKFAQLLRVALGGNEVLENFVVSKEEEKEILQIAELHDLSHIIYLSATKLNNEDLARSTKQEYLKTIKRRAKQELTLRELAEIFEKNSIDYIPLKGAVICELYPERWMRKSGDLDILVKEKDYEAAINLLVNKLKYNNDGACSHHTELVDSKGVSIEVHKLVNGVMDATQINDKEFVNEIWNMSSPVQERKHEYKMSDDWFYLYHIVHMIRHFEKGGCGIKFFIDLWYMNNPLRNTLGEEQKAKRDILLEKYGYKKFEQVSVEFSNILFKNEENGDLDDFAEYVFNAGVFGSTKQKAIYQSSKFDGKGRYLIRRIFMPYEQLKWSYPVLQKYPILTPVYELARWFRLVFKDKKANSEEIKTAMVSDSESIETARRIREMVGL